MGIWEKLYNWGKQIYLQLAEHEVSGYAAQLAYFLLMSMFPLILTLISILPVLPITLENLLLFVRDFIPAPAMGTVRFVLSEVISVNSEKTLSIGIVVTLWSASTGMNAIIQVMNRAYELEEKRHFLIVRLISVLLTIVMIIVFLFAFLLVLFGKHVGLLLFSKFHLGDDFLHVWESFRWVISSVILFLNFTALYFVTPSKKISCKTVFPGALFSTAAWIISSLGFSFYVSNFATYTVTYGSIGVVIVLMLWLYLLSYTVILGGELNAYLDRRKKRTESC